MDTGVYDDASRKHKQNEEEVAELQESTFVVASVVTMVLGVMAWYHDQYFVESREMESPKRKSKTRGKRKMEGSFTTKKKGHLAHANESRDTDEIINFMREVAESFKELVQLSKRKMKGNAQEVVHEVLNELKSIPDLRGAPRYKTIAWLTKNPDKLAILKALPLGEKKEFISVFMS